MNEIKAMLYRAVCELESVRSVENCQSGLCASAVGVEIIEDGMKLLGVKYLEAETLEEELARESK